MSQSIKLDNDLYWDTSSIRGGQIFNFLKALSGNSSVSVTIPNGFRGIIYGFRGATIMGQWMVNVSASGGVNVCEVAAVPNITYTTGTNSITFTNASSATTLLYYIGSDILS